MSNVFSAGGPGAACVELRVSNGATDVLFDVLTLAGSGIAATAWQQNLVLHFADGHRIGRGDAGFDLGELPWTGDWPREKAFLLRLLDLAAGRYGWDRLAYDADQTVPILDRYRDMVAGFGPRPVPDPARDDWSSVSDAALLVRCPRHDVYRGALGCRLCDPSIQPER